MDNAFREYNPTIVFLVICLLLALVIALLVLVSILFKPQTTISPKVVPDLKVAEQGSVVSRIEIPEEKNYDFKEDVSELSRKLDYTARSKNNSRLSSRENFPRDNLPTTDHMHISSRSHLGNRDLSDIEELQAPQTAKFFSEDPYLTLQPSSKKSQVRDSK